MAIFQYLQVVSFLLAIELVALASFPIVVQLFPWSIGYRFAISRIFGQSLVAIVLWVLVSLGLVENDFLSIVLILLVVFFTSAVSCKTFIQNSFTQYLRQEDLLLTLSFYFVFLFFLFIRIMHPEIHWGEKPMDFTFLNYFKNLNTLPPIEPWASGMQMRYYYGGFFLYSIILKLSSVPADVGYNLIVSIIPALYLTGLVAIFRSLTVSARCSVIFAVLVVFSSNPEMLLGVINGKEIDSHLFWASTRVYTSPAFTEYPFWTFLFADLHSHMMALPIVTLLLLTLIEALKVNFKFYYKVAISLILALLVLTNAWDAIACSLLIGFFWLGFSFYRGISLRFLLDSLVFAVLVLVSCLPVFLSIKTGNMRSLIWTTEPEYNSLNNIFRIFGFWFYSLSSILLLSFRAKFEKAKIGLVLIVSMMLLILLLCAQYFAHVSLPWLLVEAVFLILILLVFTKSFNFDSLPQLLILGCFSSALFLFVELVVVIDRMNSVFKFHFFLWTCVSIFTLCLVHLYYKTINKYVVNLLIAPVLSLGLVASGFSVAIAINGFHWSLSGVKKEIDGFNYYKNYNNSDFRLINWLRNNVSPGSVIAEAYGPSYQDFSRISTNTGLATLLGWDFHISQRGITSGEIEKRKQTLSALYTSPNIHHVCKMLREYRINYVVVGDLERQQYKIPENRFPNNMPCLNLKYEAGTSYILEFTAPIV